MSQEYSKSDPEDSKAKSRRMFFRSVGIAAFSLTIADISQRHKAEAATNLCGLGASDQDCYGAGWFSGPDPDANCGKLLNNGDVDNDEACSVADDDGNCHVSQGPGASSEVDENCTATSVGTDQSCGDCDDTHQTDEHCGRSGDNDDLCGHQHVVGLTQDAVCITTDTDQGCGT